MKAAGVRLVASIDEVSVVGITEVIGRLPQLVRVWRRLRRLLADDRAALFIPVDFPGFNLKLAGFARRRRLGVVYFIAPQVWAWGAGRLPAIRKRVRRMLVVFPFEVELYEQTGIPVTWVGHPLVEQVEAVPDRRASRDALGIDPHATVLVLMPGSRPSEVMRIAEPLVTAAARLRAKRELEVLVRLAPGLDPEPIVTAGRAQKIELRIIEAGDPRAVRAADLAIVASGTATLETALLGTPMVIVYRVSRLTYAIARRLVSIPSIGLVNVVAGRRIVPELVQDAFTVSRLVEVSGDLLDDDEARQAQLAALSEVAAKLGGAGAGENAARAILAELDRECGEASAAGR
jgi:lipid-A-disaccharide synthase